MEFPKDYIIGTLTALLLISIGFNVQPDDTHLCRDLLITKHCDKLSGTGLTCYPTPGTTIGKKYCSTGWEKILVVIPEPVPVEPIVSIVPSESKSRPVQYLCSTTECVRMI